MHTLNKDMALVTLFNHFILNKLFSTIIEKLFSMYVTRFKRKNVSYMLWITLYVLT